MRGRSDTVRSNGKKRKRKQCKYRSLRFPVKQSLDVDLMKFSEFGGQTAHGCNLLKFTAVAGQTHLGWSVDLMMLSEVAGETVPGC